MDQIAYRCVCAPLTTNLLPATALMVHVTVSLATLGDSVISWVCKNRKWSVDVAWIIFIEAFTIGIDCPEGFYGEDCSEECECQNGASCDDLTGQCNCTAGWMGETCNESKPTAAQYYYVQC